MTKNTIFLIGLGIKNLDQLTPEAEKALSKCTVIYSQSDQYKLLRRSFKNVIDLEQDYWKANGFHSQYKKVVRLIIEEAQKGQIVGVTTYGHPMLFDTVSIGILNTAKRRKIKTVIYPGISCLDTICIDLGIDFSKGIQIFDAESMIIDKTKINIQIDLILMQIGTFGIDAPKDVDSANSKRLRPLIHFLKQRYGSEHKVRIVYSDGGEGFSINKSLKISMLEKHGNTLFPGTTLYIPAKKHLAQG